MLGINLNKNDHIDVDSVDFKEKIAESVKEYVINNWDNVVSFEDSNQEVLVKIDLQIIYQLQIDLQNYSFYIEFQKDIYYPNPLICLDDISLC